MGEKIRNEKVVVPKVDDGGEGGLAVGSDDT